jgi:uncharacterized protein DUF6893
MRISGRMQMLALLALLAAIVAGVVAQYPELKRYLEIERM